MMEEQTRKGTVRDVEHTVGQHTRARTALHVRTVYARTVVCRIEYEVDSCPSRSASAAFFRLTRHSNSDVQSKSGGDPISTPWRIAVTWRPQACLVTNLPWRATIKNIGLQNDKRRRSSF